jgi:nucleoside-diphosphate-sugar epimerase
MELGCVAAIDSNGRTIWIADAHRDNQRFIVSTDEKLTTFMELASAIRKISGPDLPAPVGVN